MANQLAKPYSLASYFISIVGGFFIGICLAAFTEAAKDQMLAGGAIVFFYGIVGAGIALVLAFILAFKTSRKVIISMNIFYVLAIALSFFYLKHKKQQRDLERQQKQQELEQQDEAKQNKDSKNDTALLLLPKNEIKNSLISEMGLGMFAPKFHDNKTLYFYANLTSGKSVQEHTPIDSITFKQREYGGLDIATAPPWLEPAHRKLYYNVLLFKVKSISHDFVEIIVNRTTNQTAFVNRFSGEIKYWPEFLLSVSSVEFIDSIHKNVHVNPLSHSSKVSTSYAFLKPIKIQKQWMLVSLLNDDYKKVGQGWVCWQKDGQLLLNYNLLS